MASPQNPRTAEMLGEIRGMLGAFISRFDNHETQDREIAKGVDARLERIEVRSEDRASKQTAAFEEKLEQVVDKIEERFAEFSTKLEGVTSKQTFADGGKRYLLVVGGVVISIITSGASLIMQFLARAGH